MPQLPPKLVLNQVEVAMPQLPLVLQVQVLQAILALHQPVPQAAAVPLVAVPLVAAVVAPQAAAVVVPQAAAVVVPQAAAVVAPQAVAVVVPLAVAAPHHQALREEVQLAFKAQQVVLMSIWQVLLGFRMTNQQTIN